MSKLLYHFTMNAVFMMSLVAVGSDQRLWDRCSSWAVPYNSSPGAMVGNISSICAGSFRSLDKDRPHRSKMYRFCMSLDLTLGYHPDWTILEWLSAVAGPGHTALPCDHILGIAYKTIPVQECVGLRFSWPAD